jgi:hypothetical protein
VAAHAYITEVELVMTVERWMTAVLEVLIIY